MAHSAWRVGSKIAWRGRYYDEELRDWIIALVVSVRKCLGRSGNMMRNGGTGSQRLACRFKMACRGR